MKRGYSIAFGGFRKKAGRRRLSNVPSLRRHRRKARRGGYKGFARKVRSVLARSAEKKRTDTTAFSDLAINNIQARTAVVGNVGQGTANNQRIGNKITYTSMAFYTRVFTQSPDDVPMHFDLYLVVYKPGAELAGADLLGRFFNVDTFTGNFTTGSFRNQYEFQDFIVLRRKRLTIRPTINTAENFAECWIRWKGRITQTYEQGLITSNAIYMIAVASFNVSQSGDPPVSISSYGRMYYIDV